MKNTLHHHPPNVGFESIWYSLLLIGLLWCINLLQLNVDGAFVQLGILPKEIKGLWGILFGPLLHSTKDFWHIINNSTSLFVLLVFTIYFYRQVALKVLLASWIFSGLFVWLFAENNNAYHIGISGIVYALAAFLLTSGVLRKYRPLQAISLFVIFLYGSMIWGIFPTKEAISWEGHFSGLIIGVSLAFYYRKLGPQAPKYKYEIEKEMGIEPPDFEREIKETIEREKLREYLENEMNYSTSTVHHPIITYEYIPSNPTKVTDSK